MDNISDERKIGRTEGRTDGRKDGRTDEVRTDDGHFDSPLPPTSGDKMKNSKLILITPHKVLLYHYNTKLRQYFNLYYNDWTCIARKDELYMSHHLGE